MASERDRRLASLLSELADRLAGSGTDHVLVRAEHLDGADADLLTALCEAGLLSEAEPAGDAICDGCERLCPMPVETMRGPGAAGVPTFVVCDKRDDIGRVPVEPTRLRQWRFSIAQVAAVLSAGLRTDRPPGANGEGRVWSLGAADLAGKRTEVALCAHPSEAPRGAGVVVTLVQPSADPERPTIALGQLLTFRDGRFHVDEPALEAALAQRLGDERIACEIAFERGDIILLNHSNGVRRIVATPNFAAANDLAFGVLWKNPGRTYSLAELSNEARVARIPSLNKLVENLKFSALLRKLFFRVSQDAIEFCPQVTYGQLARLGIEPADVG